MSDGTLRVGIIGFGGAGAAHAVYLGCVSGVCLAKIFDPRPERLAQAAAQAPQAARCSTLDTFWTDLDAVVVCTPDRTHAEYVTAALNHGLHVLCEKPLTDSLDGLRRINAAVSRSDRVAAVVHQMRFVPLHRRIREAIVAGEVGRLSYLEGYYVHNLTTRAFVNDEWRRTDNATPLVYSGCHFIDLLRWFAGEEIHEVFAAANHVAFPEYPESDLNLVTLRFASGAIGKVLVAFGEPGPQDHTVRISGTKASIQNNVLFTNDGRWGRTLHRPMLVQAPLLRAAGKAGGESLWRHIRRNAPAVVLDRVFDAIRLLARRPGAEYGVRYYPIRLYEHALACVLAVDDFVGAVREGRPPLCTVDESGRTVLACLAGVESYRSNRPVRVSTIQELT